MLGSLFLIALGAALVGIAWLATLAGKHGWGWVLAQYHARKAKLEALAQAKREELQDAVAKPITDITAQVTALEDKLASRLAALENEIAALKAKVGG